MDDKDTAITMLRETLTKLLPVVDCIGSFHPEIHKDLSDQYRTRGKDLIYAALRATNCLSKGAGI